MGNPIELPKSSDSQLFTSRVIDEHYRRSNHFSYPSSCTSSVESSCSQLVHCKKFLDIGPGAPTDVARSRAHSLLVSKSCLCRWPTLTSPSRWYHLRNLLLLSISLSERPDLSSWCVNVQSLIKRNRMLEVPCNQSKSSLGKERRFVPVLVVTGWYVRGYRFHLQCCVWFEDQLLCP